MVLATYVPEVTFLICQIILVLQEADNKSY